MFTQKLKAGGSGLGTGCVERIVMCVVVMVIENRKNTVSLNHYDILP